MQIVADIMVLIGFAGVAVRIDRHHSALRRDFADLREEFRAVLLATGLADSIDALKAITRLTQPKGTTDARKAENVDQP